MNRYSIAIHLPLLQNELPAIAVLRRDEAGQLLAIKIDEAPERYFHGGVMTHVADLAGKIAAIDGTPNIQAHLIFSGRGYGPGEIHRLLEGRWPPESYSIVSVTQSAGQASFDGPGDRLSPTAPHNVFTVPRLAIISALRFAYDEPGQLAVAISPEEGALLQSQMSAFSERANRVTLNDPDAVLEFEGEGRVLALGVAVWSAFHADAARCQWGQERLDEDLAA